MNATFGTEGWIGLSALGRHIRLPGAAPQAGIARAVGPTVAPDTEIAAMPLAETA